MTQLEIEKGGLLAARSIAREAEHLLTLGEEALDTVGEKYNQSKEAGVGFNGRNKTQIRSRHEAA